MTEDDVVKADEVRQSLKEDGVVVKLTVIKPEPYPMAFSKWYDDLMQDIYKGEV